MKKWLLPLLVDTEFITNNIDSSIGKLLFNDGYYDFVTDKFSKGFNPDIMIVGSDWKGKEVVGEQYAKAVRFFNRVGEYSTTRTLQGLTYR